MRYEVAEDGQTIALTDCDDRRKRDFRQTCQKITERARGEDARKTINTAEFKGSRR